MGLSPIKNIYQLVSPKVPSLVSVYLYIFKAFDTLDHNIIVLSKLDHYGISGIAHDSFKSYLIGRAQYVYVYGIESDKEYLSTGVPQGSVLGPLLFLIYINDLENSTSIYDCIMYADDTTLFCNIDSIPEANRHVVLNSELDNINCWLASNKLSLNVSKTKYMIFHTNHKNVIYPDLNINNTTIERVVNFNFLRLLISANAKWTCHIDHVSRKVSRAIGIINAMKKTFPISTLVTLYNSLIMPHINYCLLIWGASSNVNRLCLLQKKILQMVTASNYIDHTEPIFKNLNILKIKDLYKFNVEILF